MALPAPATPVAGNYWKMVLFTNIGQFGFSDTFYYANQQTTWLGAWADAVKACQSLMGVRYTFLGLNATLMGARLTALGVGPGPLTSAQQASPIPANPANFPANLSTQSPVNPTATVLYLLQTSPPQIKRNWVTRGVATNALTSNPVAPFQSGISPALTATATYFSNTLITGSGTPGFTFVGFFCIKGLCRPGTVAKNLPTLSNALVPLQAVGSTANPGFQTFSILTVNDPGFVNGQQVKIRGLKLSGAKGFNGTRTITNVTLVTGPPATTLYTTAAPWKYSGPPVVKVPGSVYPLYWGLFPIGSIVAERIGSRKTGRAFFGTLGHAKASTV